MTLSVSDRLALADLVHGYAACIDDRHFADAVALFHDDAVLVAPDPPSTLEPTIRRQGRDAIRAALAAVEAVARTEHEIVGEVFSTGGDDRSARGRITCVAHHWTEADGQITDVVWHLRYDDTYTRADHGWQFLERVLTINAIETRPVRRLRRDRPG